MISFAAGLKSVIQTANNSGKSSSQIFKNILVKTYVQRFQDFAAATKCSYDFEDRFLRRPKVSLVSQELECWKGCGAVDAADRLLPILRTVDAVSRGEDAAPLMSEIQAYSLMWPAKATKEFIDETGAKKSRALITMLAFYACTWWLLSEEVWWVGRRSKMLCEAILAYVSKNAETEWYLSAMSICEYFGFKLQNGSWVVGNPGYPPNGRNGVSTADETTDVEMNTSSRSD